MGVVVFIVKQPLMKMHNPAVSSGVSCVSLEIIVPTGRKGDMTPLTGDQMKHTITLNKI